MSSHDDAKFPFVYAYRRVNSTPSPTKLGVTKKSCPINSLKKRQIGIRENDLPGWEGEGGKSDERYAQVNEFLGYRRHRVPET